MAVAPPLCLVGLTVLVGGLAACGNGSDGVEVAKR
jgi:hypothetical protein